ncbi:MAG TPA: hypothetical protein PKA20_30995 [Burkholderiaceae bacterium]|nr:hypothetical protein [Burkholderiaceae bacterium]
MVARAAVMAAILGFWAAMPAQASEEAWQRVAISPSEANVLRDWQAARRAGPVAGQPAIGGARLASALVPTASLAPVAASATASQVAAPTAGVPGAAAARSPAAGVRRGERLALDLYKTGKPLPAELLAQLPEQPRGTMLMELDGQVIRVFRPTRTVVDVLR